MRIYEPTPTGRPYSPIPPEKAATYLGNSNSGLMEIMKGVGKGALATMQGVHDLGSMAEGALGLHQLGQDPGEQALGNKINQHTTANNPDQVVGKGIEFGLEMGAGGAKSLAEGTAKVGQATLGGFKGFLENRAAKNTISALTPKMTSGEMEAAPNVLKPRIGAPRIDMTKDKGFMEMANDTKGIVQGKSAINDKNALQGAIKKDSEELRGHFDQNKVPTHFSNLIKKLELVQPQQSLKSDPNAFGTYSRVRNEVQDSIYQSMKSKAKGAGDFGSKTNPNDFWESMKILDKKSEEELGTKVFGTPEYTGAKSAIQDMRQSLMQYARDSLKFPGQMEQVNKMQEFVQVAKQRGIEIDSFDQFKGLMKDMGIKNTSEDVSRAAYLEEKMRKMSNYYKAIDNVSTKVPDEIRANNTFGKRHPLLKTAAKGVAGTLGVGATYEAGKIAGIPLP